MNDLSGRVIEAAVDVHRALGPGLREAAREEGPAFERIGRGFRVDRLLAVRSRPPALRLMNVDAPALAGRRPR